MTSRGHPDRGAGEPLPQLVSALRDGDCFDHPTDEIEVIETHISYVLLTGPFAYKIKKAVSLPFLDFSTLEFRKHYCDEELRINRRLASELYIDVVPITGTPAFLSPWARFSGVWPPNCTITPLGCSRSTISSTSSSVTGSK